MGKEQLSTVKRSFQIEDQGNLDSAVTLECRVVGTQGSGHSPLRATIVFE
jgi:hypothetical protein